MTLCAIFLLSISYMGVCGFVFDPPVPASTGFVFHPPATAYTGMRIDTTTPPDRCGIAVFANCTTSMSYVNITDDGQVHIDKQAILNFYCGPAVNESLKCMKARIDPTCGPNTDNGLMKQNLATMPTDFSKICSRPDTMALLNCQVHFPNLKSYVKCVSGETLNKTLDPTVGGACKLLQDTIGCSYKYTDLVCPNLLNAFMESAKSTVKTCHLSIETSPEAMSCDKDMLQVCIDTFNAPALDDTNRQLEFVCSANYSGYSHCVRRVSRLCQDTASSYYSSLQSGQQLAAVCQDKPGYALFRTCYGNYSVTPDYVQCMNFTAIIDTCRILETAYTCNMRAVQKMCPALSSFYKHYSNYGSSACHNGGFNPGMITAGSSPVGMSTWILLGAYVTSAVVIGYI